MLCVVASIAVVSRGNPRGLAWLAVLTANYLVSSFNWNWDGPAPELVAGLCDAAVCLLIYLAGRYIWEMRVWLTCLIMLAVNFGYLLHNVLRLGVIEHDIYASVLEVLMVAALAIIGGVSAFAEHGSTDGRSFHPWRTRLGLGRSAARAVDRDPAG